MRGEVGPVPEERTVKNKSMKKIIAMVCLLFFVAGTMRGQKIIYMPVPKGEIVPDLPLVLNKGDEVIKTHLWNYKGKMVLLDFWGVNCTVCIAKLPEMLQLQNEFKDRLQVIVVTSDTKKDIQKLWKEFRSNRSISPKMTDSLMAAAAKLLFYIGDTTNIFPSLFPYDRTLPTHVWIDAGMRYRYIADGLSTDMKAIRIFLEGRHPDLVEKKLPRPNIEINNPLTWLGAGIDSSVLSYYSFFTGRIQRRGSPPPLEKYFDRNTHKLIGLSAMNRQVIELYKMAWFPNEKLAPLVDNDNVLLEVKDTSKVYRPYDGPAWARWADSNMYCYALKLPFTNRQSPYTIMQQDLDRFFSLKSSMEKRNVKCLVLKRTSHQDKIRSTDTANGWLSEKRFDTSLNEPYLLFHNVRMKVVRDWLKNILSLNHPFSAVVDETNYMGKIDLRIPWKGDEGTITIDDMRKWLLQYDLDLVEAFRMRDVLVISDKN